AEREPGDVPRPGRAQTDYGSLWAPASPCRHPRGDSTVSRRFPMAKGARLVLALALIAAVGLGLASTRPGAAQGQTIKIGLLYDHTGPFSAAGSLNCWRGARMMIDLVNEKGGVLGKYKIVQVDGDSQSKTEAAINETERLLNVEKVDILAGV